MERYLIFSLGEDFFAFEAGDIGEAFDYQKVYPLPLAPECMLGLINRLGNPFALVDISPLIKAERPKNSRAITLKDPEEKIAIAIDDVVDIAEIHDREKTLLNDADALAKSRFKYNSRDVTALNLEAILRSLEEEIESIGDDH